MSWGPAIWNILAWAPALIPVTPRGLVMHIRSGCEKPVVSSCLPWQQVTLWRTELPCQKQVQEREATAISTVRKERSSTTQHTILGFRLTGLNRCSLKRTSRSKQV